MTFSRRLLLIAALPLCAWTPIASADQMTVEHVIHISVDGLNATLLKNLIEQDKAGRYANFRRFVDEGATTFNARTDFDYTDTLPNHTCMLTARPVLRPEGWDQTRHHGYIANVDPNPDDSLHTQGNVNAHYIASTFDVAHEHGLSTALFASKTKFVIFTHSYDAAHGAPIPGANGSDGGRAKIDCQCIEETSVDGSSVATTSADMQGRLLSELSAQHFNYVFVHYREPDTAGHAHGWGSDPWIEAVHMVDGYLGGLFRLIERDPRLKNNAVIILTADHGGVPGTTNHREATRAEDYTIPVFIWGTGVARAADLYAINANTRGEPGSARPDYNAKHQPIRNGDTGNLALKLLGLPAIPGSSINSSQDLRVNR